ncbi:hypothetical protein [Kribbella monticola]|uniref:hypothetical protein n=1 Tax=Kribbella monticola TaxID=2185285 RepID=UPI000DD31C0E|nr:hypothetical protein [Kribbella monticola]
MSTAAVLLVLILLIAALVAGTVAARQARRLPSTGTPLSTSSLRPRPAPDTPAEVIESDTEVDDPTFRAFTAALEAHAKRSDRKALYSNILFFAAGVLASILITLLVHPL